MYQDEGNLPVYLYNEGERVQVDDTLEIQEG